MKRLFACVCPQIPCKDCLHWSGEVARRLFVSLFLSLDLQKRCICNYFPFFLPHHYCTDLPLSLIFILVVHQDLCFDIHVTAWLRCKRDSCEVLGHLLLLMCVFFTSCTAFILSHPILGCCIWHFFGVCSWVCTSNTIWLLYIMWFT